MAIGKLFPYVLPFSSLPRFDDLNALRDLEYVQSYTYDTGINLNELTPLNIDIMLHDQIFNFNLGMINSSLFTSGPKVATCSVVFCTNCHKLFFLFIIISLTRYLIYTYCVNLFTNYHTFSLF
jgi:hypothetical protein